MRPRQGNTRLKRLVECTTPEEVSLLLTECIQDRGLSTVNLTTTIVDKSRRVLLNAIGRHKEVYEFDRAIAVGNSLDGPWTPANDPVVLEMRRSSLPVIWGETTYLLAGLGSYYEELNKAGATSGIALRQAIPTQATAQPVHVLLMLERQTPIRRSEEDRLIADTAHLALYALEAARRVLYPTLLAMRRKRSPLTPAMTSYLSLAAKGLSVKETAKFVDRSPATVNNVLHEALQRIESNDKAEAIRKCIENGWLIPEFEAEHKIDYE